MSGRIALACAAGTLLGFAAGVAIVIWGLDAPTLDGAPRLRT